MKYLGGLVVIIIIVGVVVYFKKPAQPELVTPTPMNTLTLVSTAFNDGGQIPSTYTCDGDNINPPLSISDVPENAASLVLIVDDPDAPVGVWDHWVKFNIPPTTITIAEHSEPAGVSGVGSGGNKIYQGPCPPQGEHRYFFKLYALDTMLSLPEGATKKEVESAMEGRILAQGQLMGRYTRHQ